MVAPFRDENSHADPNVFAITTPHSDGRRVSAVVRWSRDGRVRDTGVAENAAISYLDASRAAHPGALEKTPFRRR